MDANEDATVTMTEWKDWLKATHEAKRKKKVGSGDKWLLNLLTTLEKGCCEHEMAMTQQAPLKDALALDPMMEMTALLFDRMEAFTPGKGICKADFIACSRGDFRFFDEIDTDGDLSISSKEWTTHIANQRSEKEKIGQGSGDAWLRGYIYTLSVGCAMYDGERYEETAEEAEVRDCPPPYMMEVAALIFHRMASFSEGDDLTTAHRGDFKIFSKMDSDQNNEVTKVEFISWIHQEHSEKRKKKRGAGDRWLSALLHTLDRGCTLHALETIEETEAEADAREGPTDLMLECANQLYVRISGFSASEGMAKSDLGALHDLPSCLHAASNPSRLLLL